MRMRRSRVPCTRSDGLLISVTEKSVSRFLSVSKGKKTGGWGGGMTVGGEYGFMGLRVRRLRCLGRPGGLPYLSPFGGEEGPDHEVDPTVVDPLGFAGDALALESEALGNGAAAEIAGTATDFDAVQVLLSEQVIEHHGRAACHDSLALKSGVDPIPYADAAVVPIDGMAAP